MVFTLLWVRCIPSFLICPHFFWVIPPPVSLRGAGRIGHVAPVNPILPKPKGGGVGCLPKLGCPGCLPYWVVLPGWGLMVNDPGGWARKLGGRDPRTKDGLDWAVGPRTAVFPMRTEAISGR